MILTKGDFDLVFLDRVEYLRASPNFPWGCEIRAGVVEY